MSFVRSKLKLARESIGEKDYSTAKNAVDQVLEYEPDNYTAHVFLGLALLKLDKLDESEQVYQKAIQLSPEQLLAWQGLVQFYEHVDRRDRLLETLEGLRELHSKTGDASKTAEVTKRIIDISRNSGDRLKLVKALSDLLHDSQFYDTLSKLPPPDPTNPSATTTLYVQTAIHNELPILEEIVDLLEKHESVEMEKEIERRRMRLGSGGPEQIKKEVGKKIWTSSRLPHLYNQVINHPNTSDELRRETESKLLLFKLNYLHSLSIADAPELKSQLRQEVDEIIRGIVLLKIPNELAWRIYLEEQDCETMAEYDMGAMKQMIYLLPTSPLARVLIGYFRYTSEPIENEEDVGQKISIDQDEDPFDSVMNVLRIYQDNVLICRIAGEIYTKEVDYENAIKVAKNGLALLDRVEADSGKQLSRTRVGLQAILVTGLVHLYPPKYHQRALSIIHEALAACPNNITCLFGHAYILSTAKKWEQAAGVFEKITLLEDDLDEGLRAREEQAWCRWQSTKDKKSITELQAISGTLDELEGREHDAARCLWRVGKCYWDLGGKNCESAYTFFIRSLKKDSSFASAFTSLGFYYSEAASPPDPARASKCFQKAFELDPRENVAAQRLAEGFADDQEWDLVEVVARRTIEGEGGVNAGIQDSNTTSTKVVPTNAWAWKALGLIEMGRRNYASAIQALQLALRAEPDDFLSWSRLGEVYSKAGRHAAAIKALNRALELDPSDWICSFQIGELKRDIGIYQDALNIFKAILVERPKELSVLVSLARTYLELGLMESNGGYHMRAEDSFLNAIDVAVAVIVHHMKFRSIAWKVVSDATLRLSTRPIIHDKARVQHMVKSVKSLLSREHAAVIDLPAFQELTSTEGLVVLGLSVDACNLRVALDTSPSISQGSAWYDLAIGLQLWKNKAPLINQPSDISKKIIDSLTHALHADPLNDLYWNAFGNAHFSERPKIAQHAYIKSLELDPKNVVTWTNLGFLYYHHEDFELANEALYRAQVIDPDYPFAWLGQALVATANGHDFDAETLLTHATTLAESLPDIDVEYAIRMFYRSKLPRRRDDFLDLIPCFSVLERYCIRRPDDACGLHLFALICERIGHTLLAIDLVTRAIAILEALYEESENVVVERQFTIANITLGRLSLSIGDCQGSMDSFQSALGLLSGDDISEPMVKSGDETKILCVQAYLGSALANFMLQEYQKSLDASQEALNVAGDDPALRGQIVVLLAQTLWAMGTEDTKEAAKSQLLEYIAVDPENLIAINTLAGMGILTNDDNLVDATLSEVLSLPINQRQELDPNRNVDYLLVQHHLGQSKLDAAISVAQRDVVSEPGILESRTRLAELMLQKGNHGQAVALLATALLADKAEDLPSIPVPLRLHAIALGGPDASTEEKTRSLREVQRAIMLAPSKAPSWQALAYIRSCMET